MSQTIMLADKNAIYSMAGTEHGTTDKGSYRLTDAFVDGLAAGAATNLKGKVTRVWFDNNAGGYFAEIEVRACPPRSSPRPSAPPAASQPATVGSGGS